MKRKSSFNYCCFVVFWGHFFSLRRQISSKWLTLFNVIHISPQILFIAALYCSAYNLKSEKLYHDPWKGKAPSTIVLHCCILGAFFSLRRQISSKWLLLFNVIHISPQILFIPALLLFCLNFLWLFDFSGISITLSFVSYLHFEEKIILVVLEKFSCLKSNIIDVRYILGYSF